MTINIFVLKGDLNGKNRSGAFLFCRVYMQASPRFPNNLGANEGFTLERR